uniref:DUF295 domain-containing protein n=1 Tax=Setaria italica TaxID=4555 RepID=K3YN65_SETIT
MVALPSSWENLPPDLLDLVLHLLPSLADRVRLRAVCRPWRAAAQRKPRLPPPLPCLALRDGTLVDLQGAPVRCAPILRERVFRYLAVDDLAFLVHDDGACSLTNPLSGILSSPLDSTPDPFIAIIIMEGYGIAVSACKQLDAISAMIPDPQRTRSTRRIYDIAFFNGKLYAITEYDGLQALELDVGRLHEPNSSSRFHKCIAEDPKQQRIYRATDDIDYLVLRYLVECSGKLLMIRRWMSFPHEARVGDHDRTSWFEVFETDLATVPGQWINVDSLDGLAIFLNSECSKSVLASKCAGGVQEDCIYFMHRVFDNPSMQYFGPCVNPLGDSGVCNMRDGNITPLLPEAVMTELRCKQQYLTWFFPTGS